MEGFDTSLAEGVLLLTPLQRRRQGRKDRQLCQQVCRALRRHPNQFAADAYDAVYAASAMVAGGITADTTPEEACEIMIEQMQKLTIEGLTGTMTWNPPRAK